MLTERIIRDAKADGKDRTVWDTQVRGLGVQITQGGKKNFVIRYKIGDHKRQAIIARCSEISLKAARERVGAELVGIRAGEADPLQRRQQALGAPTVTDMVERFFREHVPGRIERGRMAERTAVDYRQQCSRYILPVLGRLTVAEVNRHHVEAMLKPLKRVQRNRVAALASRLFNLCEAWELRPQHSNPVRGIERAREEPRDRTLAPSELAALGSALADMAESNPMAVAAIRMAALTGWRIGEVLALTWVHVDLETGLAVQATTKTGRKVRNLGSAAIELLSSMPRLNDNEHVFAGGLPGTAITYKTVRGVFARAVEEAGLSDVKLHDMRRTTATYAAMAGVGVHTLRDLLGHSTLAMSNRYVRRTGGALVAAVEQSSAEMAAMMRGSKGI